MPVDTSPHTILEFSQTKTRRQKKLSQEELNSVAVATSIAVNNPMQTEAWSPKEHRREASREKQMLCTIKNRKVGMLMKIAHRIVLYFQFFVPTMIILLSIFLWDLDCFYDTPKIPLSKTLPICLRHGWVRNIESGCAQRSLVAVVLGSKPYVWQVLSSFLHSFLISFLYFLPSSFPFFFPSFHSFSSPSLFLHWLLLYLLQ